MKKLIVILFWTSVPLLPAREKTAKTIEELVQAPSNGASEQPKKLNRVILYKYSANVLSGATSGYIAIRDTRRSGEEALGKALAGGMALAAFSSITELFNSSTTTRRERLKTFASWAIPYSLVYAAGYYYKFHTSANRK